MIIDILVGAGAGIFYVGCLYLGFRLGTGFYRGARDAWRDRP